uniref:Uncharacterized protein n=1 Tax=Megaselia scalaris TaxID=36166 RepID=T1GHR5_MEGSC
MNKSYVVLIGLLNLSDREKLINDRLSSRDTNDGLRIPIRLLHFPALIVLRSSGLYLNASPIELPKTHQIKMSSAEYYPFKVSTMSNFKVITCNFKLLCKV